MRTYRKLLAVMALSGVCLAAPGPSEGAVKSAKKHKKPAAAEAQQAQRCEACEAIEQLKEQIKAQQAEIEAQHSQIETQQSQIDQLKTAQAAPPAPDQEARAEAAAARKAADEAAAAAAAAQANAGQAQQTATTASTQAEEAKKQVGELEHPNYLHYKNIQFIPGGFLAAESVWRQHAEQTDVLSNSFAKIPFRGTTNNGNFPLTEWRATGRQSRLSFKAIGKVHDVKLLGYYEMDFLGAAPTANENQSNSFNVRQRQLYADAEWHGWGFAGGQMWSLNNLTKKGVAPYDWWNPATIDAQYVPGFTFARQAAFRVYKQLNGGKESVAFSVENAAILTPVCTPAASCVAANFGGTGNQSLNNGGSTFTDSIAPDLIAKVAFDPSFGHFEIRGVGRFFRNRVGSTLAGHNETTESGGIGAGFIIPVAHKKVNLVASALFGRGTARYGDSGVVDVTIRPDGTFSPVKNLQGLGGIEVQVTPKLQWYIYGGDEYWGRDTFTTAGGVTVGYGVAGAGNQKNVTQGTGGFWYTMYKGGYGSLLTGAQYSYTYLTTWDTAAPLNKTSENMAFTSLRYVLP